MKMWDHIEQEFIFDHGWKINEQEKIILTRKQFNNYQYTGKSIKDNNVKTIMIPSKFGCCLIFENKHFVVMEDC